MDHHKDLNFGSGLFVFCKLFYKKTKPTSFSGNLPTSGYKLHKDIIAFCVWIWNQSGRSRVYHQDVVLHIINSVGIVYHRCEKNTAYGWWDTRFAWWYTPYGDDIPLLSQWIKNRQVKTCRFLVEAAGIEPASKNQFIQLSPGADDY